MSKRATRDTTDTLRMPVSDLFPRPLPVVGMVHLLPLPGSPRWAGAMATVLRRAHTDAAALVAGDVDGILVENYGAAPFFPDCVPRETVAALTRLVAALVGALPVPVGVSVLRNDARSALAVAADGAIVGSALQRRGIAGHPVDPRRVRKLMTAVAALRAARTATPDD